VAEAERLVEAVGEYIIDILRGNKEGYTHDIYIIIES